MFIDPSSRSHVTLASSSFSSSYLVAAWSDCGEAPATASAVPIVCSTGCIQNHAAMLPIGQCPASGALGQHATASACLRASAARACCSVHGDCKPNQSTSVRSLCLCCLCAGCPIPPVAVHEGCCFNFMWLRVQHHSNWISQNCGISLRAA